MPFLCSSEVSKVISFLGCDKVIRKSHLKIYIVPKLAKAYNFFFGCVKVTTNGKKKIIPHEEWPLEDRTRVGRITRIDSEGLKLQHGAFFTTEPCQAQTFFEMHQTYANIFIKK